MPSSTTILPSTNDELNVVGDPHPADGWYGFSDGLHTVAIHAVNFSGRVSLQASLANEPTENDWFDIWLELETPYTEFPRRPGHPTGELGDTGAFAYTFKANVLWLRARVDRSYLPIIDPYAHQYGSISKITLGR